MDPEDMEHLPATQQVLPAMDPNSIPNESEPPKSGLSIEEPHLPSEFPVLESTIEVDASTAKSEAYLNSPENTDSLFKQPRIAALSKVSITEEGENDSLSIVLPQIKLVTAEDTESLFGPIRTGLSFKVSTDEAKNDNDLPIALPQTNMNIAEGTEPVIEQPHITAPFEASGTEASSRDNSRVIISDAQSQEDQEPQDPPLRGQFHCLEHRVALKTPSTTISLSLSIARRYNADAVSRNFWL